MMQLLYAPTSPYVRKVMVCAHLTGQADRIKLLESAAHPIRRDARFHAALVRSDAVSGELSSCRLDRAMT